jgi:hypothetical protein
VWLFCDTRLVACCRMGNTSAPRSPRPREYEARSSVFHFGVQTDTSGLAKHKRKQERQVVRCDSTSKCLDTIDPLPRTNFSGPNGADGPTTPGDPETGWRSLSRINSGTCPGFNPGPASQQKGGK